MRCAIAASRSPASASAQAYVRALSNVERKVVLAASAAEEGREATAEPVPAP